RLGRGGLDIPARVELDAGRRSARVGRFHLEPVASPADRYGDVGLGVRRGGDGAARHLRGRGDRLVVPGIAAAVPLVVPLDLDERPVQTGEVDALARGVGGDDAEARGGVL